MKLSLEDYRQKLLGCWMGKNIGGTFGAPFEWFRGINDATYYTQKLDGNPLPNDDLDIQLLWLIMMEEQGINVDSRLMTEYWQNFVTPHWAEYGNAKINMQAGLMPPYTGIRNNDYKDSCGAFIRSEIWACIAPGNPRLAVKYAYEDASLDHGDGEGMYAEVFTAAIESAAFVINDPKKLVEIGLSYIPAECGIARAINLAMDMYNQGKTWREARDEMLRQCRGSVFFQHMWHISKEDIEKGFHTGKMGWDAPSNIGILVIGLFYGEGDFTKSMCVTVNCGEDTDCTGATIGSLFGIMHGVDAIPEKWITPIGRSIKTACLNIGELGYFGDMLPKTIDELTDRTEAIMRKVAVHHDLPVETDYPVCKPAALEDMFMDEKVLGYINTPAGRYTFPFFNIAVEYITGVATQPGEAAKIRLIIANKYRIQAGLTIRWFAPNGWNVGPAFEIKTHVGPEHWSNREVSHTFDLVPSENATATSRFVVEVTVDGRTTTMLVPVILLLEVRANG